MNTFRQLLCMIGLLLARVVPVAAEPALQEPSFRLLSYNLMGGRNTDGGKSIEPIVEVIRAWNPQVVALQEVDRKTARLDGRDLLAELESATGLRSVFGEAMPFQGGSYGVAFLCSAAMTDVRVRPLPCQDSGEPRVLLDVTFQFDGGSTVRVINTHLDHRPDDRHRRHQWDLIEQHRKQFAQPAPWVVGDLNATPESPFLLDVARTWRLANASPALPTYPSAEPVRAIDHLLMPRDASVKVRFRSNGLPNGHPDPESLLGRASDHRPLFLELQLPSTPSP